MSDQDQTLPSIMKAKYDLSSRGAYNLAYRDIWGPRAKAMSSPWTPDNPNGTVILRLAENSLLHNEIAQYIRAKVQVEPVGHLTYSTGPRGSFRLRRAAAAFLVKDFKARMPITLEDIFILPGVASAVDAVTWALCNEGEAILIPRPLYNGFAWDIQNRTGAVIVGATYQNIDTYSGFDDVFTPDMNKQALEAAFEKAEKEGIRIRALLITHPHNPLGRCYPTETLKEMAAFCGRHELHFISDEIYAHSVFDNPNIPGAHRYTSTLALDLSNVIDENHHHVLYGASKDFCANGLRLGFLYSKNTGLMGSISSNSFFSWSPHLLQDIWASMLENDEWRYAFKSKNLRLMAENYALITSFFKDKGIRYYEMNAGIFIWTDFRHYLLDKAAQQKGDFDVLKATSPNSIIYKEREVKMMEMCNSNGVMIAPGDAYAAEEYGWFRITFTVPRTSLKEGLRRIWATLEQIKQADWTS